MLWTALSIFKALNSNWIRLWGDLDLQVYLGNDDITGHKRVTNMPQSWIVELYENAYNLLLSAKQPFAFGWPSSSGGSTCIPTQVHGHFLRLGWKFEDNPFILCRPTILWWILLSLDPDPKRENICFQELLRIINFYTVDDKDRFLFWWGNDKSEDRMLVLH